jgi:hypothetical protein
VHLDSERARAETEDKINELEHNRQGLKSERNQWRTTASAGPQLWRDQPDDFAKVMATTDANKAIDFSEALEQELRRTPEWRAYQDERFAETMKWWTQQKQERDAERRAEIKADPRERRIATIKNTLELLLHQRTRPAERQAALEALLRLTDGDLDFLGPPAPLPPTAQIAEGAP